MAETAGIPLGLILSIVKATNEIQDSPSKVSTIRSFGIKGFNSSTEIFQCKKRE